MFYFKLASRVEHGMKTWNVMYDMTSTVHCTFIYMSLNQPKLQCMTQSQVELKSKIIAYLNTPDCTILMLGTGVQLKVKENVNRKLCAVNSF